MGLKDFLKQGFPEFFVCYKPTSEPMYCDVTFTETVANLSPCAKYSPLGHFMPVSDIRSKSALFPTKPRQSQPLVFLTQCLWVCVSHCFSFSCWIPLWRICLWDLLCDRGVLMAEQVDHSAAFQITLQVLSWVEGRISALPFCFFIKSVLW